MKISGCTFIRNGDLLGYHYQETIQCLLDLCDQVVVVVGKSEDNTLNTIKHINSPKLQVIETVWNEQMQDRGFVYAQQKMIAQYACIGDWVLYLECDEIINDKDYTNIKTTLQKNLFNYKVEAFVFDYLHFYGSPEHIISSAHWYKKAPRVIRNNIRSFAPDGLFWVVMNKNRKGRLPYVKSIGVNIYHYGHVRNIDCYKIKLETIAKYWNNEPQQFIDYSNVYEGFIEKFTDDHPAIIHNWLANKANWKFTINPNYRLTPKDIKHIVKTWFSKVLNLDLSKKHFKLIT